MFYGENLEQIRECYSYSRKELAEELDVTEQLIWQYELNQTEPSFENINRLKTLFNVQSQFFSHPLNLNAVEEVGKIAYREKVKGSRKKAKMELSYMVFIDTYLDIIESKVSPDKGIIESVKNNISSSYNLFNLTKETIQSIAEDVRKQLTIDSNKELMYKLEIAGIYILERRLEEEIDAYSGWLGMKKLRPYIILNKKKNPAARRNFDMAHELGHLLLHEWVDMDNLDKHERIKIENEANYFASSFLLPEKEFLIDVLGVERKSNPKSYIDLKKKYHVSIQAMVMKVYSLRLITYQQYQYFWRMINHYTFKIKEPLDDEIPIVIPGKTRALFKHAFENEVFELNDLLSRWFIDTTFLADLFCFEIEYFDSFKRSYTSYKLDNKNILRLRDGSQ